MSDLHLLESKLDILLRWVICLFLLLNNPKNPTKWLTLVEDKNTPPMALFQAFARFYCWVSPFTAQTTLSERLVFCLITVTEALSGFCLNDETRVSIVPLYRIQDPFSSCNIPIVSEALHFILVDIQQINFPHDFRPALASMLNKRPKEIFDSQLPGVQEDTSPTPSIDSPAALAAPACPGFETPVKPDSQEAPSYEASSVQGQPNAWLAREFKQTSSRIIHGAYLKPINYVQKLVAGSLDDLKILLEKKYGQYLDPVYDVKHSTKITVLCKVHAPHMEGRTLLDKKSDLHLCPWRGLIRVASDGSAAFLGPQYDRKHFDDACLYPLALSPEPNRVDIEGVVENSDSFVTACGHCHFSDGRSTGSFPPLLVYKAAAIVKDSNSVRDQAEMILKQDPELKNFSSRIDGVISKLTAAKPKTTVSPRSLESFKRTLTELYSSTKRLSINSFATEDHDLAVFTEKSQDEIFGYACTRESARLSMEVGCVHLDATHEIIKTGDEAKSRLMTVSVQDAHRKIFLVGVMVARSECLGSYAVLFKLMIRAWSNLNLEMDRVNLRRFVFDGFPGLKDLVEDTFSKFSRSQSELSLIFRASCFYHALASVLKYVKGFAKGNDGLPGLAVHLMHCIGRAPSLAAVVALWNTYKEHVAELPAHILAIEHRDKFFKYMDKWYLDPLNEVFYWMSCADIRRLSPCGPLFSRSNNVSESGNSKIKRILAKEEKIENSEQAIIRMGKMIECGKQNEFKHEIDLLSPYIRQIGIIKHLRIDTSLRAAGMKWPPRDSLSFVLCRETKILLGISEEHQARKLVGQLAAERYSPEYRSPNDIQTKASLIDGVLLSEVMKTMNIIQFHPDHLPGSKDSYSYGTCTCPINTTDGICDDMLAIHYHFLMHFG